MKPVNNDKISAHIGAFIASRRAELGLSLEDVARRAGTTKSHVWELEKGRSRNPSVTMALAMCEALQCGLNSLLGVDVSQPQFTDNEMALIAAHRGIFSGDGTARLLSSAENARQLRASISELDKGEGQ